MKVIIVYQNMVYMMVLISFAHQISCEFVY